jgi:hypothetical protein
VNTEIYLRKPFSYLSLFAKYDPYKFIFLKSSSSFEKRAEFICFSIIIISLVISLSVSDSAAPSDVEEAEILSERI